MAHLRDFKRLPALLIQKHRRMVSSTSEIKGSSEPLSTAMKRLVEYLKTYLKNLNYQFFLDFF
jgi:hypothetical protein